MTTNELLKLQYEKSAQRIRKSVEGLDPGDLMKRPQGLTPVLWQVGHLAASDASLLRRAGAAIELPSWVQDKYAKDTTGEGLSQSMDEVWAEFSKVQSAVLRLADSDLQKPIDHPAKIYQNVGEGLLYMLIHRGYHHGKITSLKTLIAKTKI